MKRLVISAIAALSITAAAHAEGITVMTPNAPVSKEQAVAYAAKLDAAVKRVCAKASTPIIGPNVYLYQECVKATRIDVEKKDPTGLYASRDSVASTVFAAR